MENVIPLNIVAEETAPCCLTLSITVPSERGRHCYDGMVRKAMQKVNIPGFRPGRVPKNMILKRYAGQISAETSEQLTNEAIDEAVRENKYKLAGTPKLVEDSISLYKTGEDFAFKVQIEVLPDVEIPDYTAFELTKNSADVKDEEVTDMINSWLEQRATYEKADRASVQGDMLKATYTSEVPEELKDEKKCAYILNAENTWVLLKEPEMIPGVSTALVGLSAGEEKDVTVTFPGDYYMDLLREKTVKYHFTVHEVQSKKVPEINEEFLKSCGVASEDELRNRVKESLKGQKAYMEDAKLREQATAALLSGQDFPLPPTLLGRIKDEKLNRAKNSFLRTGKKEEDWENSKADAEAKADKEAQDELRRSVILLAVAEKEKLSVPQEDLVHTIEGFAAQQNMKFETAAKRIQQNGAINGIYEELLLNKALGYVISKAKVTENAAE